ncbi:ATP-dependent helicase [Clostridium swellfunianum]|uniref:ATP-dependent helicase n=1 Tax=Clostridium swellfunianum TaxID=1367462 RepID=UPI0020302887|nr:ATP-dependent helicase [Clostridium swellfunianum]MCM0648453.1 ATP-dependent helicase [Clostridium swellfunianum]
MDIRNQYCYLRDLIIEKQFCHLDEQQKEAVFNIDRNVLVLACPGSGKTTVLINKVLYLTKFGNIYKSNFIPPDLKKEDLQLLQDYYKENTIGWLKSDEARLEYILSFNKINPNSIVVITFTKAAALNMKKRYQALSKSGITPFFGTFHGLFYKLLIRHNENIKIMDSSESYRIISNTLARQMEDINEDKIKDIRNKISLFKCNEVNIENFKSGITQEIFVNCYNVYENYKKEKGLLDFDDIQLRFKDMLIKNSNIAEHYRKGFKYILVDEFQDSDNIQLEILHFLNSYNNIFAVGDEDQCIYSFRGSRPDYMVDFHKHFEEGKKLQLSTNYRSAENIVNIAASLIKNNGRRNDKKMLSWKKEIKIIDINNYHDENSQAESIALNIEKLVSIGSYNFKDSAVLFRTNLESRSLIDAFIRKKIPFRLLEKEYNFFDHFICKDLAAYLRLSIIKDDADSFKRIINKPFRYVSKVSLEKLNTSNIRLNCFDFIKSLADIPIYQIKTLDSLERDIHNLNRMSLQSAIQYIITGIGYHDHLREYSQKFKIDLSELEEILDEFKEAAAAYNSITTFLAHIEYVGEELNKSLRQNRDDDRVILSTIHGVKGMEFKNVFIINCLEEVLPHINNLDQDIEEERRLMYVAVTRAIDNLYICLPRNIRGKHKEPSRFIKECSLDVFEDLKSIYRKGDEIIHNSFGKGRIIQLNSNVLEISFGKDIIRKFDITILHNHGIIKRVR